MKCQKNDSKFNRQVGRRLRSARIHRVITLEDLADTPAQYKKLVQYEEGLAGIPLDELHRIATVLDVSIYYFMEDADLLQWFDEQEFVRIYRLQTKLIRERLRIMVFAMASDRPILPE